LTYFSFEYFQSLVYGCLVIQYLQHILALTVGKKLFKLLLNIEGLSLKEINTLRCVFPMTETAGK